MHSAASTYSDACTCRVLRGYGLDPLKCAKLLCYKREGRLASSTTPGARAVGQELAGVRSSPHSDHKVTTTVS